MNPDEPVSEPEQMCQIVVDALDAAKGDDVRALDVRGMTDITDFMIIASGATDRHIKALAEHVRDAMRAHGYKPLGIEGEDSGDWILVDFGDVVVHLMRPATRSFYDLEGLWSEDVRALVEAHREGRVD
jgi:ribosome-associated protein